MDAAGGLRTGSFGVVVRGRGLRYLPLGQHMSLSTAPAGLHTVLVGQHDLELQSVVFGGQVLSAAMSAQPP